MAWVNMIDVVRDDIAETGKTLDVGGAISTPRIHLTGAIDSGATVDNDAPLIIGSRSEQHISIDSNEIMAKSNATSAGPLYLNDEGGTVHINGRQYGLNKVLATAGMWMSSSQTASLSEAISAQPHGVILVWSRYSGGSVNYEWSYTFVPKYHVIAHAGTGMYCYVGEIYAKYLYIYDTKIVGYGDQGSGNGSYVLRYVIGV